MSEPDDLGFTLDEWWDLQIAYNRGTLEPREGTREAAAFRRMDEHNRAEVLRREDS